MTVFLHSAYPMLCCSKVVPFLLGGNQKNQIDYLDIGNRHYVILNKIVFEPDFTPACHAERSLSVVKHLGYKAIKILRTSG